MRAIDGVLSVQQEGIPLRSARAAPPIIGFRDWQLLKNSEHFKGQTMLVVSQNYGDSDTHKEKIVENSETREIIEPNSAEIVTSTITEITRTTTVNMPTSTTSGDTDVTNLTNTTASSKNDFLNTADRKHIAASEDHISNFVRLLRETAPILPYIPTLVRSLTTSEVSPGKIPFGDVRYSPVKSQHFYNTESVAESLPFFHAQLSETTSSPNIFLGLFTTTELSSTIPNVFGISSTTLKPIKIVPTVYPVTLINSNKSKQLRKYLERKPTQPAEDLNSLHGELFKNKDEVVIFKKATKTENELATQLAELARILPTDAMTDLQSLQNIPDIDGLLQGMDLSLIRKPGGFAKLRQQFIQRFMKRSMGLPFTEVADNSLVAPIVPVKVTKKAMKQRAFRVAKLVK